MSSDSVAQPTTLTSPKTCPRFPNARWSGLIPITSSRRSRRNRVGLGKYGRRRDRKDRNRKRRGARLVRVRRARRLERRRVGRRLRMRKRLTRRLPGDPNKRPCRMKTTKTICHLEWSCLRALPPFQQQQQRRRQPLRRLQRLPNPSGLHHTLCISTQVRCWQSCASRG